MAEDLAAGPRVAKIDDVARTPTSLAEARAGLFPTLLVLFFATGACALVYQQLWVRLLSLVFGVTVYAVSTVLASFFGGLAVGSYIAGRLVDRARRPLRWYGIVEILVGAAALGTSAALVGVERLYVVIAAFLPDSVGLVTLVRFVLASAVLLVSATLMGASLPIVVRSALVRSAPLGERVSLLYATNTAGAIVGTLIAGFWLIGAYGVTFSFRSAAAVNIAAGIVAVLGSRLWEASEGARAERVASNVPAARGTESLLPDRSRHVVLLVFAISGFVGLGLEVVWVRALVLYVDSTAYAFTIMLATVLAGIALGSYVVAPLMRLGIDWIRVLIAAELALGVAALLSLKFLSMSYLLVDRAPDTFGGLSNNSLVVLVASGLAIFPTTLLFGFALPIGIRLWAAAPKGARTETGRLVGIFYAFNVAAGIAGSVVVGFVLLPLLGTRRSVVVLAALLLASGLTVLFTSSRTRLSVVTAIAAVSAFVLIAVTAVPNPYAAALVHRYPGERLLWQDEGPQTTVSIHASADRKNVRMYLNGLEQASTTQELVGLHRLIGSLPMAVHPDPESALVIGLGGGVTAGGVAAFGNRVDVVELSNGVVQGSRYFGNVNGHVLEQPNVHVRVDDGRNFLLTTDKKYDVITADIIPPDHAGAANLWSVDFWRLARGALAEGGVILQWIPLRYDAEYKLIMRSFLEVFPNATLWADGAMMIGSRDRLTVDRDEFERRIQDPQARAAVQSAGLSDFNALLATYTAASDDMRDFSGDGPLLTDDKPRLEYWRSVDRSRSLDLSPLLDSTDPREILER